MLTELEALYSGASRSTFDPARANTLASTALTDLLSVHDQLLTAGPAHRAIAEQLGTGIERLAFERGRVVAAAERGGDRLATDYTGANGVQRSGIADLTGVLDRVDGAPAFEVAHAAPAADALRGVDMLETLLPKLDALTSELAAAGVAPANFASLSSSMRDVGHEAFRASALLRSGGASEGAGAAMSAALEVQRSAGRLRGFADEAHSNLLGDVWPAKGAALQASVTSVLEQARRELGLAAPTTSPSWSPPPLGSGLAEFGSDLTERAASGALSRIVGRDAEVDAVEDALRAGSAVLVGDAGVGKTAVAEALAQRIADGSVHPELARHRVLEIDTRGLGATEGNAGDIEKKMQRFVRTVQAEPTPVIVFADELHSLMGVGTSKGNETGVVEMLKPLMARGQLKILGATTRDEYPMVTRNAAFARRLSRVDVEATDRTNTAHILRSRFATGGSLRINDDAYEAAYDASLAATPHLHQPDASIKLVQRAVARVERLRDGTPAVVREARDTVERLTTQLESVQRGGSSQHSVEQLRTELAAARAELDQLEEALVRARIGDPATSARLRQLTRADAGDTAAEIERLVAHQRDVRAEARTRFPDMDRNTVTSDDVRRTAAELGPSRRPALGFVTD